MKEFKRILFPVDLSESSEKIVPYVQTVAEKFESEIHAIVENFPLTDDSQSNSTNFFTFHN